MIVSHSLCLPDIYKQISYMYADDASIHGESFFNNLRIRSGPFIRNIKPDKFLMGKKMKNDFDNFYKNVNGKLETDTPLWSVIKRLKEIWDQFLINCEEREKEEQKIEEQKIESMCKTKIKIVSTNFLLFDLKNIMKNESLQKLENGTCIALWNGCNEDAHITILNSFKMQLVQNFIFNFDKFLYFQKINTLSLLQYIIRLMPLWTIFGKNSVITEPECLVNLARNSADILPMKLKIRNNFILLEMKNVFNDNIENKFLQVSKLQEDPIPNFLKTEIEKQEKELHLNLEPPEIYQCQVREIKTKNQNVFKIIFSSKICAIKKMDSPNSDNTTEPNSYEKVGYSYTNLEKLVEMCLYYKISGIKKIQKVPHILIDLDEYMTPQIKEKVDEGIKTMDKNLEFILAEYKKFSGTQLRITKANDERAPLMILPYC